MESIEIDREVFAHLQKHARPFVDTPNSTLRRLLGIDTKVSATIPKVVSPEASEDLAKVLIEKYGATNPRSKAPKADLEALTKNGFLVTGQKLYLLDYQRNRVQNFSATVDGGDLVYAGKRYAMSALAQFLLSKVGFRSKAVRGPIHWADEEGRTVRELWKQYRNQTTKR